MEGDDLAAPHAGSEEMMCRRAKQQAANKQAWKLKDGEGWEYTPTQREGSRVWRVRSEWDFRLGVQF